MEVAPPRLAVSAVLHLGTLVAVLVYFRHDVAKVLRLRTEPEGRKLALLVVVGTIPALVGFPLAASLDRFQATVSNVGWALIATGVILVIGQRLATGSRNLTEGRIPDAVVVGIAQAISLIPGISRSGLTIAAGNARKFTPTEAARFSFLLGIPTTAGAGLTQIPALFRLEAFTPDLVVALVVAGVSGYAAIALLLAALRRVGLTPFALYLFAVGALTVIMF